MRKAISSRYGNRALCSVCRANYKSYDMLDSRANSQFSTRKRDILAMRSLSTPLRPSAIISRHQRVPVSRVSSHQR